MTSGSDRLFDLEPFSVDPAPTVAETMRRGPEPGDRFVRVLPDVSGLEREFDYLCPARWAEDVAVGSLVRFDLNRRRVGGWVTAIDVTPHAVDPGDLLAISKVSSIGPPADVVDLARWAARRWHGRLAPVLRAASPPRMVRTRPVARESARRQEAPTGHDWLSDRVGDLTAELVGEPGTTCIETSPADDPLPLLAALDLHGGCLVVTPDVRRAHIMAGRLRRLGIRVHLQPNQWSGGFSGGLVIGSRSAVWAPVHDLRWVVVIDEHDESLQAERVPTWHARDVAVERARRSGAHCLLISPVLSLAARQHGDRMLRAPRAVGRRGWPITEVIDRRRDELGFSNLFSTRLTDVLRSASSAVLVLNRKGRARLLACRSCGELVRTEDGNHLMIEDDGGLVAPATGERRPLVCAHCGGTGLKRLRLGVGQAAEQLSRLVGRPVTELSGSGPQPTNRDGSLDGLVVGTEAALHAVERCDVVAFLDFDQELMAPRYRAGEQAMALVALAARLVGGRQDGGRILIQTRAPDHRVIRAAVAGDPERWARPEARLRSDLGFPPFGALAELSGAGAADYAAALRSELDTAPGPAAPGPAAGPWSAAVVLGPRRDERFLLSVPPGAGAGDDPDELLAELLAHVPRPKARVRVAVDPPRA